MTDATATVTHDADPRRTFVAANTALDAVVEKTVLDRLDEALPESMAWFPGQTVRQYLNTLAYENRCVPDMLAGRDDLVANPDLKEDLLGDDPLGAYRRHAATATGAADGATDDDLARTVHMSYNDEATGGEYLRDITLQRSIGAIDLGGLLGVDPALPNDLVHYLLTTFGPVAPMLRDVGVFGPEVEVPDDASPYHRLLGMIGRKP